MSREKATFRVGGCVRDKVMGVTPHDIDFVVVGETVESMLKQGFKLVGQDFPVFLNEDGDEFALARTERKSGKGYGGFTTDHSIEVTLEDGSTVSCLDGELFQEYINAGFSLDIEYSIDELIEFLQHIDL